MISSLYRLDVCMLTHCLYYNYMCCLTDMVMAFSVFDVINLRMCAYAYMHTCNCILENRTMYHKHTHIHTQIHTQTHTHKHTHKHTHIHTHIHTYTHKHTHTHTHTQTHTLISYDPLCNFYWSQMLY